MAGATGTGGFVRKLRATREAFLRVIEKLLALLAKPTIRPMRVATIKVDHRINGFHLAP